jgi:hypothetical protein
MQSWRHIFDEFGSVTPPAPPLHGHPHIIGLAVLTAVKELYSCSGIFQSTMTF